jgi:hypothetical protein
MPYASSNQPESKEYAHREAILKDGKFFCFLIYGVDFHPHPPIIDAELKGNDNGGGRGGMFDGGYILNGAKQ